MELKKILFPIICIVLGALVYYGLGLWRKRKLRLEGGEPESLEEATDPPDEGGGGNTKLDLLTAQMTRIATALEQRQEPTAAPAASADPAQAAPAQPAAPPVPMPPPPPVAARPATAASGVRRPAKPTARPAKRAGGPPAVFSLKGLLILAAIVALVGGIVLYLVRGHIAGQSGKPEPAMTADCSGCKVEKVTLEQLTCEKLPDGRWKFLGNKCVGPTNCAASCQVSNCTSPSDETPPTGCDRCTDGGK